MSIKLNKPLSLSFDELELDNHIPSIKFEVVIRVKQLSHSLDYKGEVWIACSVLDHFVIDLVELGQKAERAVLKDMNDNFSIEIKKHGRDHKFLWSMKREGIEKDIISSGYQFDISEDTLSEIKNEFINYPKWW